MLMICLYCFWPFFDIDDYANLSRILLNFHSMRQKHRNVRCGCFLLVLMRHSVTPCRHRRVCKVPGLRAEMHQGSSKIRDGLEKVAEMKTGVSESGKCVWVCVLGWGQFPTLRAAAVAQRGWLSPRPVLGSLTPGRVSTGQCDPLACLSSYQPG